MLERFNVLLPTISIAALAALSIFNVGYFWRIGLHFLGVIDLSNIVYSFGLAAVILGMLAFFVPSIVRHFSKISSQISARSARQMIFLVKVIYLIGGALGWFALFGPKTYLQSHLSQDAVMLLVGVLGLFGLVTQWWLKFSVLGDKNVAEISFIAMFTIGTIFLAGSVVSDLQLSSIDTYDVTTKTGVLQKTRIIRSSSTGFILFVDGRALFVPGSEVLLLKSNFSPDERQ